MGWYDSAVGGMEHFLQGASGSKQALEDMVYQISRQEKAAAGGSWIGETWAGAKGALKLASINVVYGPGQAVVGGAYVIAKEGPNLGKNTAIVFNALSTKEGRQRTGQVISAGVDNSILSATQTVREAYKNGELLELGGKVAGNVVSLGGMIKTATGAATATLAKAGSVAAKTTAAKTVSREATAQITKQRPKAPASVLSPRKQAASPPCKACTESKKSHHKPISKRRAKIRAEKEVHLKNHHKLDALTKGDPALRRRVSSLLARHNSVVGKKLSPTQVRNYQLHQFRDAQGIVRHVSKNVPANTATLFSGLFKDLNIPGQVIRAETVARQLEATGLNTIFQSQAGKILSELENLHSMINGKNLNFGQLIGRQRLTALWEIASGGFAKSAQGVVTTIKGSYVLPQSIYNRIESPALAGNIAAIERIWGEAQLGNVIKGIAGETRPSWLPQKAWEELMNTKPPSAIRPGPAAPEATPPRPALQLTITPRPKQ